MTFFSYGSHGSGRRRPVPAPMPSWAGAPDNWLPGAASISLVVAQSVDLAVTVSKISVFPAGFEFDLTTATRRPFASDLGMMGMLHNAAGLRLGIAYSDGARADLAPPHARGAQDGGLRVIEQGGRGGETVYRRTIWVSPLPPPGEVTFAAAWPEQGLPEATVTIDGSLILDAAERAVQLWPDEPEVPLEVDFSDAPPLPPGGTPPADAQAAEQAIRDAFSQALGAAPGASADALTVVQDGAALIGAMDELRSRFPLEAATSRVVVGEVVFLDEVRAALNFQMVWSGAGGFGSQLGYAVCERGQWKVARDTYCRVLGWGGVIPPPPPPV